MRTIFTVAIAIAALAVAWHSGPPPVRSNPANSDARPSTRPVRANGQFRGMAVQLHCNEWFPDVYDQYHPLIAEIAELGADTVQFVVHAWQDHAGSLDMHLDAKRTADSEQLGRLCDLAHAGGLRVILMPVVMLKNPRNNEWRGQIVPRNRDWDDWFRRFTRINVHFAKIGERHRVEALIIGSELIKAEAHTNRWRRMIEEVRQHYRGKLGYSANWDHYQTDKIRFWPELDFVGMTTYYELAKGPRPGRDEIDANWARIKSAILAFQREVRKPIIFTEVGWCSQEGAAAEAWNYYQNQKATDEGHAEQVACYKSFLKTWSDEPAVGGIIWWEWDTSAGGEKDFNYTPRAKPAEQVLRKWFAEKDERSLTDKKKAVPSTADRNPDPESHGSAAAK